MRTAGYILGHMQYAPTWVRSISTDKEYYPCGRPGTFWGVCNTPLLGCDQFLPKKNTTHAGGWVHIEVYAICPYRVMNNFYRKRILPMRAAGYILGRMQYAPTGLGIISIDKEYQPCRRPGTYWGVCNTPQLGCDQLLSIKNIIHADSGVHTGAYAFVPLPGYE